MEVKILQDIISSENVQQAENIIRTHYPDWLICSMEEYCDDYPHLTQNWDKLCSLLKVEKRKIVIVKEINFNESPDIYNKLCEFMTKNGYVVRREGEFIGCEICGKAIPSMPVWSVIKQAGLPVPEKWSEKCSRC
jgi:hypothetical protein